MRRSVTVLTGACACLGGSLGYADPALIPLGAAIMGTPAILAAGSRSGVVHSTPQTVEAKLRADLMADRIDTIDFALAVDRAPNLDAPAVTEATGAARVGISARASGRATRTPRPTAETAILQRGEYVLASSQEKNAIVRAKLRQVESEICRLEVDNRHDDYAERLAELREAHAAIRFIDPQPSRRPKAGKTLY